MWARLQTYVQLFLELLPLHVDGRRLLVGLSHHGLSQSIHHTSMKACMHCQ